MKLLYSHLHRIQAKISNRWEALGVPWYERACFRLKMLNAAPAIVQQGQVNHKQLLFCLALNVRWHLLLRVVLLLTLTVLTQWISYPSAVYAESCTFPQKQPFGTGSDDTRSVAIGDLNGDHTLDLVVGNYEQDVVYWNDGHGNFVTNTPFGTGLDDAESLVVGDLNGDGALDIVVGNMGEQNVVYWNNGIGNFANSTPFGTGSDDTTSVAVGDLNGDGKLDIVVGNREEQNGIYWNDGNQGFAKFTPFGPDADNTWGIALGDLNHDRHLDIVVGNNGPNAVYWNDGNGQFVESAPFGTGSDPTDSVALGDLNGDDHLDIVVGNSHGQNAVYWNDGSQGFTNFTEFGPTADRTWTVAIGDVNSDGALDIVVGNSYEDDDIIYWNNGYGEFVDVTPFGTGHDETDGLAIGDLNADGALDIVSGNQNEQNVIYWNTLCGDFADSIPLGASKEETESVMVGDLDRDGALDIVTGNHGQEAIYWNDGKGNLDFMRFGELSNNTWSVALGDLNGDGWLDIVVGNAYDEPDVIYWNDGQRGFTDFTFFGSGTDETENLALGDLDRDGDLDIVAGNYGEQNVIYWNDGKKGFNSNTPFGTDSNQTDGLALGDLNGDGWLDIVVGNYEEQNKVYWNNWQKGFTESTDFGTGSDKTNSLVVGDLNGDGWPDIVIGNDLEQNMVYWNDGKKGFDSNTPFGDEDDTSYVTVDDLDHDSDLDIIVGKYSDNQDVIYWNDGPKVFDRFTRFGPLADETRSIAIGDLNGDGTFDIVLGNQFKRNAIYWNDNRQTFATSTYFGVNRDPTWSMAVDDFNGDKALDIVAGNESGPNVIYWNDNERTFAITTPFGADFDKLTSVAVGDLNQDGALDVVAGEQGGQNRVYWNDSNHSFATSVPFGTGLDRTTSVALGDLNEDGALDIVVGNDGEQNFVYWNDGMGNFATAAPFGTGSAKTRSIALGDLNDDGALDVVVGNMSEPNMVYWNDGKQGFAGATPFGTGLDRTSSVVLGDLNRDGALDIVVGNDAEQNVIYWNDGKQGFTASTPFGTGSDWTTSIVVGDFSGDGALDIVVGNRSEQDVIYWNDGRGNFVASAPLGGTDKRTTGVVVGDLNGDGALDVIVGYDDEQNAIYLNHRHDSESIPNTPPYPLIIHPVATGNANLFSSPEQLENTNISIPYTLFDREENRVGHVAVFYALNGSGQWLPAIAAAGTVTTNLAASPEGVEHIFVWDTFASGLFGRFDNVTIRIEAYTQPPYGGSQGSYDYPNSLPGPFLWTYTASTTFPFSVRGTQVRVYHEMVGVGNEVVDALVYRLAGGHSNDGGLVVNSLGKALRTNQQGYLRGHGALYPGDRLMALVPITTTDTYTLYHTSATPTLFGLDIYTITAPGVQTLTVSAANPLLLFDLTVSLEWDAGSDQVFLTQLQENLHKASRALYDWTNGQVALGHIAVYQNKERWDEADIQVLASNQIRPHANRGGIITQTVTLDLGEPITLTPGAIRIGPTWNRYGEAETIGEDWPRVLAHELGHYALYLEDTYLGLDNDLLIPIESCRGTAMTDPYSDIDSEFRYNDNAWQEQCSTTLAALPDWEIITRIYPALHQPPPDNFGPAAMPFAFTTVDIQPPAQEPPAPALDDPNVQLDDVRLSQGRVYLIRPGKQMVDLGRPVGNTVLARGARQGDELCVFAETAFTCTILTNGAATRLSGREAWQPQLWLNSLNATTLQLWVNDPAGGALNATVYANGQPPLLVTLTSGVTATISLSQPALDVLVDLRGDEEGERLATGYAIGSGPGRTYSYGGPFTSGDGSISLIPPRNQPNDAFMVLQTATGLPGLPPGRQPIGRAYAVRSSTNLSEYEGGSITFQYLGRDVLLSGLPEKNLAIYYHSSGGSWQRLYTVLNQTQNFASAPMPGPGLYVLMVSYMTALSPGWNNVSYQLQEALPVTSALASVAGHYTTIYGYYPTDTDDPWKVYDIDMPNWATDLAVLEPGKGYWIRATESITWYLSRDSVVSPAAFESFPVPPATYYGVVLPTASFTPTVGMTVIARVNGQICGQSETQSVDGQIVYVVDVAAEGSTEANACGSVGQLVSFEVGSAVMAPSIPWNNDRPQAWSLSTDMQQNHSANLPQDHLVYLPMAQKGGME